VDWSGSTRRRKKRRKRIRPRSYGLPMSWRSKRCLGLGSYGVLNEIKPSNMWIESDRTLRKG